MSRKDTIIIAVLVNAGLLVVLFASALKSNKEESAVVYQSQYEKKEEPKEISTPAFAATSGDEVDQVLRQYSQSQVAVVQHAVPKEESIQSEGSPSVMSSQPPKIEVPPSFADEIRALNEAPASSTAAQPAPKGSSEIMEVRVQKGDVLDKIARRYQVKVEDIMRLNNLKSTSLSIGQILKIPAQNGAKVGSAPKTEVAQQPSGAAASGAKYYVVKAGDSPWSIATKNHIKVDELLKLNNLTAEKAKKLKPGTKLRVK